jgi:glycosyltransferase involved in cell wall biosynthesis
MKIVFSWNELPVYAAYLLNEAIKINKNTEIISIRSHLPIKDVDKILMKKVYWVKNKNLSWRELGIEIPDIFFQAGWYKKAFSSLGNQVKENGGKVVLLSDNQYLDNFRQKIGSLIYKIKYLNHFDAVWVPGNSGVKLMKSYGVKKKNIYKGLYASNNNIYKKGLKLSKREKLFLYVGNLYEKKGFIDLIDSYKLFCKKYPGWKLIIVGNGPLRNLIPKIKSIKYFKFSKPKEISNFMKASRFLINPSHEDHWPLVVNEATLCGCGLILSNNVGNIDELSNYKNSIIFKKSSSEHLFDALIKASQLDGLKLDIMFKESLKLGSKFTVSNWRDSYYKIIKSFS